MRITALAISLGLLGMTAFDSSAQTHGKVFSSHGKIDSNGGAMAAGSRFPVGTNFETGPDSRIHISPSKGVEIFAREKTAFSVTNVDAKMENGRVTRDMGVSLAEGSIIVKISNGDEVPTDFLVRTPIGVAAARGTIFRVTYNGEEVKLTLEVLEGKVFFVGIDGANIIIPDNEVLVVSLNVDTIEVGDYTFVRTPNGIGNPGDEPENEVTPIGP